MAVLDGKSLRLAVLGLAALASTATSDVEDYHGYHVSETVPADGAIDVSPDVIPSMRVPYASGEVPPPDPAWLTLRTAAGVPVAGTSENTDGAELIFVPDAPLADGDYVLVLAYQPELDVERSVAVPLDDSAEPDLGVHFRVSSR